MIKLVSNSPRRLELLKKMGFGVTVIENNSNESIVKRVGNPREYVRKIAVLKLENYLKKYNENNLNVGINKKELILTADTIVYYDNFYIGKGINKEDVINTISILNNNWHEVYTAVAFYYNNKMYTLTDKSEVKFKALTRDEILKYAETNLWTGKAGCYGIQDNNNLVEKYKGSINNIIGLPVEKLLKVLKNNNILNHLIKEK